MHPSQPADAQAALQEATQHLLGVLALFDQLHAASQGDKLTIEGQLASLRAQVDVVDAYATQFAVLQRYLEETRRILEGIQAQTEQTRLAALARVGELDRQQAMHLEVVQAFDAESERIRALIQQANAQQKS